MKKTNIYFLVIALFSTLLISCEKEEIKEEIKEEVNHNVAYVVNYGSYSGGKSTIDIYDVEGDSIILGGYASANPVALTSNIQSMAIHNDTIYCMSNNGDKIDIVDAKTLEALSNPIFDDITKPRYFAATENSAYISCWGDVVDWSVMATSYIAKVDLATKSVTKIDLPGGTEGVIIAGNKLYVALTCQNKVAVMDLTTEVISYIEVSAIPQQFVKDEDGNIWVSLVSTYSNPYPAGDLGVAIIDPSTDTVIDKVDFTGIGGTGYLHISPDYSTIYVMGSEAWPGTASTIFAVDVVRKSIDSNALITGENFYGFNVNPENGDVYVLISPSATEPGSLKVYDADGDLLDTESTGIGPQHVVFYNFVEQVVL
jgi:hypothetical protein